jgi:hypothetical protein
MADKNGGVTFGGALVFLRWGKRVQRSGWAGGVYLKLKRSGEESTVAIYRRTRRGDWVPWLGNSEDLLATDWVPVSDSAADVLEKPSEE